MKARRGMDSPFNSRSHRPGPAVVLLLLGASAMALLPGVGSADPPADLQLVQVASGFNEPVAIRHAGDGSGRLFIVEQPGVIRIWDGAQVLPTPFLDLSTLVEDSNAEEGLLGLAFHPDYSSNGFFFLNYTRPPGSGADETAIVRRQVSAGDPNVARTDPSSIKEILAIPQDFNNHNGGDIHFSPIDDYLYIGMGDGGSGGDPNNRAQDLGSLLGKILRIDIDPVIASDPYDIPENNPFVGVAGQDEIWSYGLRNPWRWSFDRLTGDLVLGDVGQVCREEVNFQVASSPGGENYGWDCREGSIPYDGDTGPGDVCTNQPNAGSMCSGALEEPFFDYNRSLGSAVTGGYVYRGARIGGLQGTYVFADWGSGRIWFANRKASGDWAVSQWMDTPYNISAFGEDEGGELYLTNYYAGTIYRFESASSIHGDQFESKDLSGWSDSSP